MWDLVRLHGAILYTMLAAFLTWLASANFNCSKNPGRSIERNSFKDRLMGTVASTVIVCQPITTYMYKRARAYLLI